MAVEASDVRTGRNWHRADTSRREHRPGHGAPRSQRLHERQHTTLRGRHEDTADDQRDEPGIRGRPADTAPPLLQRRGHLTARTGVPVESTALAIVVDDPDAPPGTFTHWVVLDIAPSTTAVGDGIVPTDGSRSTTRAGAPATSVLAHRAGRITTASRSTRFAPPPVSARTRDSRTHST